MSGAEDASSLLIYVNELGPEAAVARLVEHAADLSASDLFLTSSESHVTASVRHLGLLRMVSILPLDLGRRCLSHIKAVADMDVSEHRRPLDGRWLYRRPEGNSLDLRINTIPTLHGEDVALRLLARDQQRLRIEQLGLLQNDYNQLLSMLSSPSGLLLVTGPTGAGKTTTLYACLSHLNNGERKINTIEDPIEYAVDGIRQSQVNPRIDVGFPELLRSVLRQAADVIMVGEIRDPVTAETAVQAANSGHLVLATLHSPVAAGAIQSMLSLGAHPHFLSGSLLGVLAQRLVRTLCPHCKVAYDISDAPQTFEEVKRWLAPGQGQTIYGPHGCAKCHQEGYAGRTGVFEVLTVSRDIRKLILAKETTQAIRHQAVEEGVMEFRQAALLHVARGITSVEEVFRVVPSEYLSVED
jgi:type II secretory ATPase GspE/PulE/Tfp pilus assembly ATPase PilB-like protein